MANLTLVHQQGGLQMPLPYWVFVNGQPIGVMRNGQQAVRMSLPEGYYQIGVAFCIPFLKWKFCLSSNHGVHVHANETVHLEFHNRERAWNILFDIDLLFWIASFFYTPPAPWDLVYQILSNGFFAVWLLRLWLIRKHYFIIDEVVE